MRIISLHIQFFPHRGFRALNIPQRKITNISTAVDDNFGKCSNDKQNANEVLSKFNLRENYIMYTGGIDFRKNIDGLIEANSKLPPDLRKRHELTIVCSINDDQVQHYQKLITESGLSPNE